MTISQGVAVADTRRGDTFRFQEVHLELTTACNFRCGFCPLTELQRPAGRLDFELAESILRQCINERICSHATFHLMGEALLHPQCMEILDLCRDLGIGTRLVTNGSLFREDRYRRLFHTVETLDISYRTVDDMEVQSVQKKLTFEQYLDKVMAAIDLRKSLPESTTMIRIRVFISPKTIPSLVHLCRLLGVDPESVINARSTHLEPYQSFMPFPWLTFLCEKEHDWVGHGKHYPSHFGNCNEFEIGFAVLANGDVTTCCWDAHGGNVLGNAAEESLKAILFSEKAEAFRASFRRHTCPTETCRKCLGRTGLVQSIGYQALSIVNLR